MVQPCVELTMQELRDASKHRGQSLNPWHTPAFDSCLSRTLYSGDENLVRAAPETGLFPRYWYWEGVSTSGTLSCHRVEIMPGSPVGLQGLSDLY